MLLVLNPKAGGGTAIDRWTRIRPELTGRHNLEVEVLGQPGDMPDLVARGIAAGHRTFVAGGGDGTVNALCNALLDSYVRGRRIGAIGLGSSNDFHKPGRAWIGRIPIRLDSVHTFFEDVGRLVITRPGGGREIRHWMVNASIGLTADANLRFNLAGGPLGRLKGVSTGLSIGAATLLTLLHDRGHTLSVTVNGSPVPGDRFRNLAFIKNPSVAGCLHYDTAPGSGEGVFHFHAVGDVPLPSLLRILFGLVRGRFAGSPGTRSVEAATSRITGSRPFAVEFDGEVMEAVAVDVSVIRQGMEVCS